MSKESYIRGFCKTATAAGFKPGLLAKFAQNWGDVHPDDHSLPYYTLDPVSRAEELERTWGDYLNGDVDHTITPEMWKRMATLANGTYSYPTADSPSDNKISAPGQTPSAQSEIDRFNGWYGKNRDSYRKAFSTPEGVFSSFDEKRFRAKYPTFVTGSDAHRDRMLKKMLSSQKKMPGPVVVSN